MQFTFKKIVETEEGKKIIGIDFAGKKVEYDYEGEIDDDVISKIQNRQIIFEEGKVTGAWNENGQIVYCDKDKQLGHDTVR